MKRALRYFRLTADDDAKLDIKLTIEKLALDDRDDDIILVNDSSGTLQPRVWLQNASFQDYLKSKRPS